jgi:hypothetical protein
MKRLAIIPIVLVLILTLVGKAAVQEVEQLQLGLSRDFGYGGFGNDIQGLFSMKINDPPENLASVDFMIDGEVVFSDTEAPFRYQFTTDNYPLGEHTLSAKGTTTDGHELISNELVMEFVPASNAMDAVKTIILPIVGLVVLVMLVTFIIPVMLMRRKGQTLPLGAPRNYGFSGGTICPKCKRAFAMHAMGLNVVVGKLDLCPHCGKWSVVRRYSRDVLDASAATELELAKAQQVVTPESEEEKLRKELEESKYHDV